MKNKTNRFILNIVGFIGLALLIWIHYIRERIPRDIPFNLSLLSLFILLITCFTCFIMIKRILKPKPPVFLFTISKYIHKLMQPFYTLDKTIRQVPSIKQSIANISYYLHYINYKKPSNLFIFYIISQYLSRVCLLILFLIDVLYFRKIEHMYLFVILGIIPLLFRYVIHLLRELYKEYYSYISDNFIISFIPTNKEQEVEYKEENEEDFLYELRVFLGHRVTKNYGWEAFDYRAKLLCPGNMKTDIEKSIELEKFYLRMPVVINLEDFLFYYDCIFDHSSTEVFTLLLDNIRQLKRNHIVVILNLIIYLLYLLIWLYILLISIPSFHITDMEWMFIEKFQDIYNPFTDIIENDDKTKK